MNPFNTDERLQHFIDLNLKRARGKDINLWSQPIELYIYNLGDIELEKKFIKKHINNTEFTIIDTKLILNIDDRPKWVKYMKLLTKRKNKKFSFPKIIRKTKNPKKKDASVKLLIFYYKDIVLDITLKIDDLKGDFKDHINYSITIDRISAYRQDKYKDINNYTPKLGAKRSNPGDGLTLFSLVVNILSEYPEIDINKNIHWYGELSPYWTRPDKGICHVVEKIMRKKLCLEDHINRMNEPDKKVKKKLYMFDPIVLYEWSKVHNNFIEEEKEDIMSKQSKICLCDIKSGGKRKSLFRRKKKGRRISSSKRRTRKKRKNKKRRRRTKKKKIKKF
jgi:hypothetical protein